MRRHLLYCLRHRRATGRASNDVKEMKPNIDICFPVITKREAMQLYLLFADMEVMTTLRLC